MSNEHVCFPDPQAARRLIQPSEEGGGFGAVDSGEETFSAPQQN